MMTKTDFADFYAEIRNHNYEGGSSEAFQKYLESLTYLEHGNNSIFIWNEDDDGFGYKIFFKREYFPDKFLAGTVHERWDGKEHRDKWEQGELELSQENYDYRFSPTENGDILVGAELEGFNDYLSWLYDKGVYPKNIEIFKHGTVEGIKMEKVTHKGISKIFRESPNDVIGNAVPLESVFTQGLIKMVGVALKTLQSALAKTEEDLDLSHLWPNPLGVDSRQKIVCYDVDYMDFKHPYHQDENVFKKVV